MEMEKEEGEKGEEKKEVKKEGKQEESLLKELCGEDTKLHDVLSNYLYINPLTAISSKDLATLIVEAEKSGDYKQAVDKAIFEAAQNPDASERYITLIQNLVQKSIPAMEQKKEEAEKAGLTDQAVLLGRRVENRRFVNERAEDIICIASKYYNERLIESEENVKREARKEAVKEAERKELGKARLEKEEREARKVERKGAGREEKREAEKQDKREELAGEERKEKLKGAIKKAEREEQRIGEMEKAEREARKRKRGGN